jgi:RNA polymerase sigma-70 factor (ECF subfamily)
MKLQINIEAFYRRYGPMVLRRCRQLLKNEHGAFDAMQDTFVKLMRYQNKLTGIAPSGLLYRIATNVCLNMLRSQKYHTTSDPDDILLAIASKEDTEQMVWVKDTINRIFGREKPTTKLIAVMHYVDGMTYGEIAEETGLSVSGVRKRLRMLKERAREKEEY